MKQIEWFDRPFKCIYGPEYLPGLIERLKGTEICLSDKIAGIPEGQLNKQVDGKWSVKQNIFHLTDLEPLWRQRVKDIQDEQRVLTPADLDNTATDNANLRNTDIKKLLQDFRQERDKLIFLLENFPKSDLEKRSPHPRLNEPMRISDLVFFIAEHDNHHLLRIGEILAEQKIETI